MHLAMTLTLPLLSLTTRDGLLVHETSARPSWAPGASLCYQLPNFKPVDAYPSRSPLAVADFLAPIVKDRSFCEIGTRNGDISSCLQYFARGVTAIEMDKTSCKILKTRGYNVLCKMVERVSPEELGKQNGGCEVYFWWPMDAATQNEKWLLQLIVAHRKLGTNASVFVGHDTHWKPDMEQLPKLVNGYGGRVSRVFFDEGGGVNGPKSYSAKLFDRPGMWGVTHVAEFSVGPAQHAHRNAFAQARVHAVGGHSGGRGRRQAELPYKDPGSLAIQGRRAAAVTSADAGSAEFTYELIGGRVASVALLALLFLASRCDLEMPALRRCLPCACLALACLQR